MGVQGQTQLRWGGGGRVRGDPSTRQDRANGVWEKPRAKARARGPGLSQAGQALPVSCPRSAPSSAGCGRSEGTGAPPGFATAAETESPPAGKKLFSCTNSLGSDGSDGENSPPPHRSRGTLPGLLQFGTFTLEASFVKDQNKRKCLAQREAEKELKLLLIFHRLPSPPPILAAPVFCFVSFR